MGDIGIECDRRNKGEIGTEGYSHKKWGYRDY